MIVVFNKPQNKKEKREHDGISTDEYWRKAHSTDSSRKGETLRHLQDLGFAPGAEVECVGETPGGMILIVKGVRIALDRGLASKIMVA